MKVNMLIGGAYLEDVDPLSPETHAQMRAAAAQSVEEILRMAEQQEAAGHPDIAHNHLQSLLTGLNHAKAGCESATYDGKRARAGAY